MPSPYTVHDSPALVARIDRDLATVTETVRHADPGLRSLVLTGGFARGEGTVRGGQPQNDYDFVAVRRGAPATALYRRLAADLERRLGLHIDLAPVAAWRLRWTAASIFWYETALRGRVLWGEDLRTRIRTRTPGDLDRDEALRLLVNRAAGLLLVTSSKDAHAHRIQASKALLAAADAHLLAHGLFAPSQRERWDQWTAWTRTAEGTRAGQAWGPWVEWAYRWKVEPDATSLVKASDAWTAARAAVLAAVPVALAHAGMPSVEAYGRRDGVLDRLVYLRRSRGIPGAWRLGLHPTGRVRTATLQLLAAAPDGRVPADMARQILGRPRSNEEPLRRLDLLRRATLQ